ncbi:hypothetical protein B7P43_G03547 [Cryptotermes secundus]|uniref:ENTH domain-containing protein n=1 Tax=Cryptotermes secundus TaxID=105785 RepID=A0A2J7R556_9NEOP|nr:hypothetical protein B7P43_G03547 [Cryptotermes secundus]
MEDKQVNVAGLRRTIKNIVCNYSVAQIKVREATSNDPGRPRNTLMSEISDMTYNVIAFAEIMQIVWKRLNENGRNWRHVYKSLVLLEYLIKTGTRKVAQQSKDNIFVIQTLQDFHYFEEDKDQGLKVREKAKEIVSLLEDDERLQNERARALKLKKVFAKGASGIGSEGKDTVSRSRPSLPARSQGKVGGKSRNLETARPQSAGEEELQIEVALAMSREEAEEEEQRIRSDDVRLQLALSRCEEEFNRRHHSQGNTSSENQSYMLDLLGLNLVNHSTHPPHAAALDPWGFPQPLPLSPPARPQNIPWSIPASSVSNALTIAYPTSTVNPWTPVHSSAVELVSHKPTAPVDPWRAVLPQPPARPAAPANYTWTPNINTDHSSPGIARRRAGFSSPSGGHLDIDRPELNNCQVNNVNSLNNNNPFNMSLLGDSVESKQQQKKTLYSFLLENSNLVDLDNLMTVSKPPSVAPALSMETANPFAGVAALPPNLFQQQQQIRPGISQIRQQSFEGNVQGQESRESELDHAPTHRPVLPNPFLLTAQSNPFLS